MNVNEMKEKIVDTWEGKRMILILYTLAWGVAIPIVFCVLQLIKRYVQQ